MLQIKSYLTFKKIYNFAQLTLGHNNFNIFRGLPTTLLLVLITFIGDTSPTFSQTKTAVCLAPKLGEYLLLVVAPTNINQQQLRLALPSSLKTVTCKNDNQTVVRIGGFSKIDDANRWAKYIDNVFGLFTIISTRTGQVKPVKSTVTSGRTTPKTPPSLVPYRTTAPPAKPSVVSTLEESSINKIAKQITVRIDGKIKEFDRKSNGSGVIVEKQGNTYIYSANKLARCPNSWRIYYYYI